MQEFVENKEKINIKFPAKPEYVSVMRLTISAIANRMGFDIEEIEDIKVSVSEACTNAIKHGKGDFFLVDVILEKNFIKIKISDDGKGYNNSAYKTPDLDNPSENGGLGIYIIRALMDKVDILTEEGKGYKIEMIKMMGDK